MKTYIYPSLLVVAAIGLFFWYTNPTYQSFASSNSTISSLNSTAQEANSLSAVEQQVRNKYNALTSDQITHLQTFLPDTIDTIRLIAEIDAIGAKAGVAIQGLSISSGSETVGNAGGAEGTPISGTDASYGTLPFSFSVTTSYPNFIAFLNDIQQSLQLMDVQSISIGGVTSGSDVYDYSIGAQTYWLK